MSLAWFITSSSSLNLNRGATGPNVSLVETTIFFVTSVRSVGSKKFPPNLWRLPPVINFAPFDKASFIWFSTFKTASSVIKGPKVTFSLKPSPTSNLLTALDNFCANSS